MKTSLIPVILVLGAGLCTLPAGAQAVAPGAADSYLLGPNDQITVHCVNAEEFTKEPIRVDGDGFISLPFLGRFKAGGSTVSQVAAGLSTQLTKYIVNPQVSVNLVETHSQPVSVIGAVGTPGVQQIQGKKRILEVLSLAGGLKPDAGRFVRVTRDGAWGPIPMFGAIEDRDKSSSVVDIDAKELFQGKRHELNIEVRPNDVIFVPVAGTIYVVGEVKKPGGFSLHDQESMSVLQAVSLAEGLRTTAKASRAKVLRRNGSDQPTEIDVDLGKLLAGRGGSDMALKPDDILFVPNNTAKNAGIKTLDVILQAATGVVIYGRY